MGASLNPRFFKVDLKMFSEIRVPWIILFYISLSCLVRDYQVTKSINPNLFFMTLAHFLYVNACMKGEECIPTTWDIFHEKFGFMLIFWNYCGVPFSYCYSSLYILNRSLSGEPIAHSMPFLVLCYVMLLAAYFVWDLQTRKKIGIA